MLDDGSIRIDFILNGDHYATRRLNFVPCVGDNVVLRKGAYVVTDRAWDLHDENKGAWKVRLFVERLGG